MAKRRFNLPSVSSLVAFEAVARLRGFARAAEELNTSQSAISRHIRNLEIRFRAELFHREGRVVTLTPKGNEFYVSVVQALDSLQASVSALSETGEKVSIVCSHSVSHLLLMPHYGTLRKALGQNVDIRLLTAGYNLTNAAIDTGADIVFEYSASVPNVPHVMVCAEEVKPVGTPEIIEQAIRAHRGECPPPGLLDLSKQNFGWMNWTDWHAEHPDYASWKVTQNHDSYVYLLEAAAAGEGLALGWKGFVETYLARGLLVELPCDWHSKGTMIFARVTRFGKTNPKASAFLKIMEQVMSKPMRHVSEMRSD